MSVSKDIIIDLMNTSTIEDIEIIGEEWPLRWICPIFNDQYDFESNPLELYKDYEHSGTDESKMISIQSEIIIEQKDEDLFIIEEGTLWSESHVWCKEINTSTPGCLPLYNKKEIKGLENLLSELENVGSVVSLTSGTDVGVNCKRDQDDLDEETGWDEWYGKIVNFDFITGLVKVKDEDTDEEFFTKIGDLFAA